MLGEVNTQILTIVMLDVLCTTLFHSFFKIHLKYFKLAYKQSQKPCILRSAGFSKAR